MKRITKNSTKLAVKVSAIVLAVLLMAVASIGIYFVTRKKAPAKTIVNPIDFSIETWDGVSSSAADWRAGKNFAKRGGSTYTIDSVESFIHFVKLTNDEDLASDYNFFKGYTVYLNNSVDLNGYTIDSIGKVLTDGTSTFQGTFDGGYYTIYNGEVKGNGLFESVENATIKNIGLYNVKINGNSELVGGIVGKAVNTNIKDVYVRLGEVSGPDKTAGIVGEFVSNNGAHSIENSFADTTLSGQAKYGIAANVSANNSTNNQVSILNCYYAGAEKSINTDISLFVTDKSIRAEDIKSTPDLDYGKYFENKTWCDYSYIENSRALIFNYPILTNFNKVFMTGSYYESVSVNKNKNETVSNSSLKTAFEMIEPNNTGEINLIVEKVFMNDTAVVQKDATVTISTVKDKLEIVRGENATEELIAVTTDSTLKLGEKNKEIVIDGNRDYFESNNLKSGSLIHVQGEDVEINGNITLKNNINNTTSAGGAIALFDVDEQSARVQSVIKNVNVENCSATNGGAIAIVGGSYKFEGGEISGCYASNNGGAMFIGDPNEFVPTPEDINVLTKYSNGKKISFAEPTYLPGMIPSYVDGYVFNDCHSDGNGGAVYISDVGAYYFGSCTFSLNTSNNGAAIYLYSGNYGDIVEHTFEYCTFVENESTNNGGAMYLYQSRAYLVNSEFSNNKAGNLGGAIISNESGLHVFNNCYFGYNETGKNGGAIFVTYNCQSDNHNQQYFDISSYSEGDWSRFVGNHAGVNGGAVYINGQDWTYNDWTGEYTNSSNNIAYYTQFDSNTANLNGGAVYSIQVDVSLGGQYSGNTATNSHGGAIYIEGTGYSKDVIQSGSYFGGNHAGIHGGAIFYRAGSCPEVDYMAGLNISGSRFSRNSADVNGGAVYLYGSRDESGCDYRAQFSISSSAFTENTTEINGGAIYVYNTAYLNISDCKNTYGSDPLSDPDYLGFYGNQAKQSQGGAIYASIYIITTVNNVEFTLNKSAIHGGAIFVDARVDAVEGEPEIEDDNYDYEWSALTVNNSLFDYNETEHNGGAIYFDKSNGEGVHDWNHQDPDADDTAFSKIKNTTFTSNKSGEEGGAIYTNHHYVKIYSSTFTSNEASSNAGAIRVGENNDYNSMDIDFSTFEDNITAKSAGAILIDNYANVKINGSTFDGNKATTSGGGRGGAIYVKDGSDLYISYHYEDGFEADEPSIFTNNAANDCGGAIFLEADAFAQIYYTGFNSNTSGLHGGAIYYSNAKAHDKKHIFDADFAPMLKSSIEGGYELCWFASNTAKSNGGAIYVNAGDLSLSYAEFTENEAGNNGGALYINSSAKVSGTCYDGMPEGFFYNEETLSVTLKFDGNSAKNGGAVYTNSACETLKVASIFTNNSATTSGGALYNANDKIVLGSVYNEQTSIGPDTSRYSAYFSGNSATNGGAIYNAVNDITSEFVYADETIEFYDNSATNGGAIYNNATASEDNYLSNVIFDSNSATSGGAIYGAISIKDGGYFVNNTASSNGGAIYSTKTIYLKGDGSSYDELSNTDAVSFYQNISNLHAGSIYTTGAIIDGVRFVSMMESKSNAGALYIKGSATVTNSSFVECFAGNNGGAVYVYQSNDVSFINCEFNSNAAAKSGGGAMYINASTVAISGTSFTNNSANIHGGAIQIVGSSNVTITSSNISGNAANTNGGAIHISGTSTLTTNGTTTFSSNKSNNSRAGAIYIDKGCNVTLSGSTSLRYNTATLDGGAIYTNGTLSIGSSVTISNNSATRNGGGVCAGTNASIKFIDLNDYDVHTAHIALYILGMSHNTMQNGDFYGPKFYGEESNTALAGNNTYGIRSLTINWHGNTTTTQEIQLYDLADRNIPTVTAKTGYNSDSWYTTDEQDYFFNYYLAGPVDNMYGVYNFDEFVSSSDDMYFMGDTDNRTIDAYTFNKVWSFYTTSSTPETDKIYYSNTTSADQSYTINHPTKDGYTFAGWSTANDAEPEFEAQAGTTKMTISSSVANPTFYAVWEGEGGTSEETTDITFHSYTGYTEIQQIAAASNCYWNYDCTISGKSTGASSSAAAASIKMPEPKYIPEGYRFIGWAHGSTEYTEHRYMPGNIHDYSTITEYSNNPTSNNFYAIWGTISGSSASMVKYHINEVDYVEYPNYEGNVVITYKDYTTGNVINTIEIGGPPPYDYNLVPYVKSPHPGLTLAYWIDEEGYFKGYPGEYGDYGINEFYAVWQDNESNTLTMAHHFLTSENTSDTVYSTATLNNSYDFRYSYNLMDWWMADGSENPDVSDWGENEAGYSTFTTPTPTFNQHGYVFLGWATFYGYNPSGSSEIGGMYRHPSEWDEENACIPVVQSDEEIFGGDVWAGSTEFASTYWAAVWGAEMYNEDGPRYTFCVNANSSFTVQGIDVLALYQCYNWDLTKSSGNAGENPNGGRMGIYLPDYVNAETLSKIHPELANLKLEGWSSDPSNVINNIAPGMFVDTSTTTWYAVWGEENTNTLYLSHEFYSTEDSAVQVVYSSADLDNTLEFVNYSYNLRYNDAKSKTNLSDTFTTYAAFATPEENGTLEGYTFNGWASGLLTTGSSKVWTGDSNYNTSNWSTTQWTTSHYAANAQVTGWDIYGGSELQSSIFYAVWVSDLEVDETKPGVEHTFNSYINTSFKVPSYAATYYYVNYNNAVRRAEANGSAIKFPTAELPESANATRVNITLAGWTSSPDSTNVEHEVGDVLSSNTAQTWYAVWSYNGTQQILPHTAWADADTFEVVWFYEGDYNSDVTFKFTYNLYDMENVTGAEFTHAGAQADETMFEYTFNSIVAPTGYTFAGLSETGSADVHLYFDITIGDCYTGVKYPNLYGNYYLCYAGCPTVWYAVYGKSGVIEEEGNYTLTLNIFRDTTEEVKSVITQDTITRYNYLMEAGATQTTSETREVFKLPEVELPEEVFEYNDGLVSEDHQAAVDYVNLAGWAISNSAQATYENTEEISAIEDLTLYAVWNGYDYNYDSFMPHTFWIGKNDYIIVWAHISLFSDDPWNIPVYAYYNYDLTDIYTNAVSSCDCEGYHFPPTVTAPAGYEFVGWSEDGGYEYINPEDHPDYDDYGDNFHLTYYLYPKQWYAVWAQTTDGGEGEITHTFHVSATASQTATSSVTYQDKTIYWNYKLTECSEGGASVPGEYGKLTMPAVDTSKVPDGFKFIGWSTNEDNTVDYAVGAEVTVDGAKEFYAVYERTYVLHKTGDSEAHIRTDVVNYAYNTANATTLETENPTLAGYAFAGWTKAGTNLTTEEFTTPVYTSGSVTSTAVESHYYAVWSKSYVGETEEFTHTHTFYIATGVTTIKTTKTIHTFTAGIEYFKYNDQTVSRMNEEKAWDVSHVDSIFPTDVEIESLKPDTHKSYNLVGWTLIEFATSVDKEAGAILAEYEDTEWYAVYGTGSNYNEQGTLQHIFYAGEDEHHISSDATFTYVAESWRWNYILDENKIGYGEGDNVVDEISSTLSFPTNYVVGQEYELQGETVKFAGWAKDGSEMTEDWSDTEKTTATWTEGDTPVSSNTVWYAVWLKTSDTVIVEGEIEHTFVENDAKFVTSQFTIKTVSKETHTGIDTYYNFDGTVKRSEVDDNHVYDSVTTEVIIPEHSNPVPDGFTFLGWTDTIVEDDDTLVHSSIVKYEPGNVINVNSSVTLYAIYKADVISGDASGNAYAITGKFIAGISDKINISVVGNENVVEMPKYTTLYVSIDVPTNSVVKVKLNSEIITSSNQSLVDFNNSHLTDLAEDSVIEFEFTDGLNVSIGMQETTNEEDAKSKIEGVEIVQSESVTDVTIPDSTKKEAFVSGEDTTVTIKVYPGIVASSENEEFFGFVVGNKYFTTDSNADTIKFISEGTDDQGRDYYLYEIKAEDAQAAEDETSVNIIVKNPITVTIANAEGYSFKLTSLEGYSKNDVNSDVNLFSGTWTIEKISGNDTIEIGGVTYDVMSVEALEKIFTNVTVVESQTGVFTFTIALA